MDASVIIIGRAIVLLRRWCIWPMQDCPQVIFW
jgi:hypothetical protein